MHANKKVVLIIGGNIETVPAVKIAKKFGYITVITDDNINAPAKKFSDYFLKVSTYDIDQSIKMVVNFNKKIKIDAVMSMTTDVPLTVSKIASKLKLPNIPINTTKIFTDKYLMKKKLKQIRIPIPKFYLIKNFNDLKKKIQILDICIIKPVDSRGARGVYIINHNTKNLKTLYEKSKSFSSKKKIIVEEFLKGQQLSTETIISNYKVKTIGISDRNYEFIKRFQPNVIENGSDLPSKFHNKYIKEIDKIVRKISIKLNIKNGTMKGDLVIHKNKIYVIEFAPRLSGGYFSSIMIPKSSEVNLIELAIKIHLGEKINLNQINYKLKKYVTQRFFFPKPGIVKKIRINKNLLKKRGVEYFQCYLKKGDKINNLTDHTGRAGQVITSSNSKKVAIELANKICNSIKFN